MKDLSSRPPHHPGQHLQMFEETVQDPYLDRKKLAEPSTCTDCGATYSKGSWKWGPSPEKTHASLCPACKRIHDKLPAGYVTLKGPYARQHGDDILALARHFAAHQKTEHPLKRIIAIAEDEAGNPLITTTDIHLARGIGEAIHKAHQGHLDYHYNHAEYLLRVQWER